MGENYANKSTIGEIRERFDGDVERFSHLDTGQVSIIDAVLMMELITEAACRTVPEAKRILDIGCGAGNNTLKLLSLMPDRDCDLLDLSGNMLARAEERVRNASKGIIRTHQGNFRTVPLKENGYGIILAAAVLHHLRDDDDWEEAFEKLYRITAPGGSVWISDLISHESPEVRALMDRRHGEFLESIGGREYKEKVFSWIEKEDTPRPLTFQTELLRKVGFSQVEILHKNGNFAAYGALKGE
jgi:tRNA (cmo5U34)-methyltransferase